MVFSNQSHLIYFTCLHLIFSTCLSLLGVYKLYTMQWLVNSCYAGCLVMYLVVKFYYENELKKDGHVDGSCRHCCYCCGDILEGSEFFLPHPEFNYQTSDGHLYIQALAETSVLLNRSLLRPRMPETCFTCRAEDRPFAYPLLSYLVKIKDMFVRGLNALVANTKDNKLTSKS